MECDLLKKFAAYFAGGDNQSIRRMVLRLSNLHPSDLRALHPLISRFFDYFILDNQHAVHASDGSFHVFIFA
jgi:hypothetical protein